MNNISEQIEDILTHIDLYYEQSFRVVPEECNSLLVTLAEKIEKIASELKPEQTHKLNEFLIAILQAMKKGDSVMTRDYIWYELKPFLIKLRDSSLL
jgi:hypothetical protein